MKEEELSVLSKPESLTDFKMYFATDALIINQREQEGRLLLALTVKSNLCLNLILLYSKFCCLLYKVRLCSSIQLVNEKMIS